MKKQSKDTICAVCTLIIVILMVGAAQITVEKEIIFPEITAIVVGMLLAPKRSWQTSKLRILILITICAISGVLIVLFLPVTKPVQMTFAFAVCQIIFLFSRTTFAPLISAMVLPVMLGTENIIYIIAAIVLTILAMLIPETYVVIYLLQILTGAGILMFTAWMLQKVKMLKLRES